MKAVQLRGQIAQIRQRQKEKNEPSLRQIWVISNLSTCFLTKKLNSIFCIQHAYFPKHADKSKILQ